MKKSKAAKNKRLSLFTKYYIVIAATVIASLLVLGTIFSLFLYDYWVDKSFESLNMAVGNISGQVSTDSYIQMPLQQRVDNDKITSAVNAYAQMNNCDIIIMDSAGRVVKTNDNSLTKTLSVQSREELWQTGTLTVAETGKMIYNKLWRG